MGGVCLLACALVVCVCQVLTQLYDDIVNWSAALGIQLATHPVPPLRKLGLSLQPTSWTVKDVCKVLKAVGLEEYMELFVEHRVQVPDLLQPPPIGGLQGFGRGRRAAIGSRLVRWRGGALRRPSCPCLWWQGDVLFNLTEENLKEMGVGKVGDRLLITDITQTLYEQVTGWQQGEASVPQANPNLKQLA